MKLTRTILVMFILALWLGLFPTDAQSCAACFGASDSQLAKGMNAGIMVLLFFVTVVLSLLSVFFVYLWKRALANQSDLPSDSPTDTPTR